MFHFHAKFVETPEFDTKVPPVRITLPDGTLIASDQPEISQILSRALSRNVTFDAANRGRAHGAAPSRVDSSTAKAEEYWPDIEGLDHRDTVTEFTLPEGTFFDAARRSRGIFTTYCDNSGSNKHLRANPQLVSRRAGQGGVTVRSLRLWTPACRCSTACANNW